MFLKIPGSVESLFWWLKHTCIKIPKPNGINAECGLKNLIVSKSRAMIRDRGGNELTGDERNISKVCKLR